MPGNSRTPSSAPRNSRIAIALSSITLVAALATGSVAGCGSSAASPGDGGTSSSSGSSGGSSSGSGGTGGDAGNVAPGSDGGGSGSGSGGGSSGSGSGGTSPPDGGLCTGGVVGYGRPVQVFAPNTYDCTVPTPLVVLLHDYGSSGDLAEAYFGLQAQATALRFLYMHPDGIKDASGNQFWNATDACCDVGASGIDDSSYLSDLLYQVVQQYNVDPKRVYVIGQGNGGFMAYRLACDHAPQITAVADLGGAMWTNSYECPLEAPISALEIHGTADTVFAYDGGTNLDAGYPSAPDTVATWLLADQCVGTGKQAGGAPLDLDSTLAGAETTVTQWTGCPLSSGAALWSIQGGAHVPTLSTTFTSSVLSYLFAHVKP